MLLQKISNYKNKENICQNQNASRYISDTSEKVASIGSTLATKVSPPVKKQINWNIGYNTLPAPFQHELSNMGYYGSCVDPNLAKDLWNYLLSREGTSGLKDVSTVVITIPVDRHHTVQLRIDSPMKNPRFTWM